SVEGQVRGYVMALFNYADAHPDSFRLLFDGTAVDEMAPVRRDLVDMITGRVAEQIRRQLRNLGLRPGPSTELLAAMMVGLVGGAARHIQRAGQPGPIEAGEL